MGLALALLVVGVPANAVTGKYQFHYTFKYNNVDKTVTFPFKTSKDWNATIVYTNTNVTADYQASIKFLNATNGIGYDTSIQNENVTFVQLKANDAVASCYVTMVNTTTVKIKFTNATHKYEVTSPAGLVTGSDTTQFLIPKVIQVHYNVDVGSTAKTDVYIYAPILTTTESINSMIGLVLPTMLVLMVIGVLFKMLGKMGR